MQKILTKVSVLLTVFMMVLSLTTGNVFATSSSQDGLVINTVTDKETYKKGEKASITISITNTNYYDMKNITICTVIPKELEAPETDFEIPLLKANESKEYQVVIEKKNSEVIVTPIEPSQPTNPVDTTTPTEQPSISAGVKTSDNAVIGGWICVLAISLISIVFSVKRNKKFNLLAVALVSIMGMGSISMHNIHAENNAMIEKTLSTVQNVVYDDETYAITVNVSYLVEETSDNTQMIIHQGETIRLTSNSEFDNETLITFNSTSGAIIDYAYYSPQEKDLVNGHAKTSVIVNDKYSLWISGKSYVDITILEGELILDKTTLDKNIVVNTKDTPALTKYTLNTGDTWMFKQKDGIDFEELGLSVYLDASNGSAHVDELIKDIENNNEYTYDYDYSFENDIKHEIEYHANVHETELTIKCASGTIDIYVRSDNLGELEIIK